VRAVRAAPAPATFTRLLALVVIAGTAGVAAAQDPPDKTPLEWIAAAEEMHAAGRGEDATGTLLYVRGQLNEEPASALRANLRKAAAALADKCDTHVAARRRAFAAAAEALNALSREYQLRKWYRMS